MFKRGCLASKCLALVSMSDAGWSVITHSTSNVLSNFPAFSPGMSELTEQISRGATNPSALLEAGSRASRLMAKPLSATHRISFIHGNNILDKPLVNFLAIPCFNIPGALLPSISGKLDF